MVSSGDFPMLRKMSLATLAFALMALSDGPTPPSSVALAYFQHALALIKEHHRNSAKINWDDLAPRAQFMLGTAVQPADTYPAIRFVLSSMNERHSFLIEPSQVPGADDSKLLRPRDTPSVDGAVPTYRVIHRRFGYLNLPQLNTLGADGAALGAAYTASVREGLTTIDKHRLCGWIIDLQDNGGGNMWPMMKGLDPLLGSAPFGYFVQPNGDKQAWIRANGQLFPSEKLVPPAAPSFPLAHFVSPIAVLIGPHTASSGEMLAIGFKGRAGVRLFGAPSAGLTSANRTYSLSDGAILVITEAGVQDRTGRDYDGPILPDVSIAAADAPNAAERWLTSRCAQRRGVGERPPNWRASKK